MSEFEVGDRIAGYELLELVGEGFMGRVYRAVQPRLERVVAVKIIRPELVADEGFRERFRREMRLAASVDHPNIIPVYEADESDGALFAAMRWVAGPNLKQLLAERGPLDPAQAIRIVGRVAAALEAAHGVGLVHRDLKPTNVLLEGDRVYLSDFGLAASTDTTGGEHPSGLVGDVEYAAPELLDHAPPDPRTDVYGLGCVLYEMLTGSVPFPPESLAISSEAPGAREPVPASKLRGELPSAIDAVLRRALATAPSDRYRTPAEFMGAVQGALGAGAASAAGEGGHGRRRLLALAAAAVIVVAAVAVLIVLNSGGGGGSRSGGEKTASTSTAPVGGRTLPAPSSLPECDAPFSGPPRECRSSGNGVNVITDIDKPLRLATMNMTVTKVREASELRDSTGAGFTAPTGTRFLLIDATVTNITKTKQTFEADNLTIQGRNTALWIFDSKEEVVPYHGPEGADYSAQYDTVTSTLSAPLTNATLLPKIPYSGQLVFYYPTKTLEANHHALLEVHELGRGFAYHKTLGGIRLDL
jgi:protein kinase-like protein